MTEGFQNGVDSYVYEGKIHKNLGGGPLVVDDFSGGKTLSKFGEGKDQRMEKVLSIQESSGCM